MSKIKILPEILSNKIAAGEVVERPASVVKELLENALDAGSTSIIIEVEKGGRSLIRVSDNGIGMNRDDALLATERYATSKIYKDKDLFAIQTLGFRGEALPSIASVSRFSMVTRDASSRAGTEIIIEGGTVKTVSDVGAPAGTMVTVKQLFYNTPARRKFLKTINTEMGHIADTVASTALGWPQIRFRLVHNQKVIKNWPAVSSPVARVVDVLGRTVKNHLHRIESSSGAISIAGWISSAGITRSTSRGVYVYINGRFVRDRVIRHALFEGYGGRLVKGQFPVAVLFVKLPFDQVDVNVHPTKHEVRFARQNTVHDAVKQTVADTLQRADRSEWTPARLPETRPHKRKFRISEPVIDFGVSEKKIYAEKQITETDDRNLETGIRHPGIGTQTTLWKKKRFADLKVIGQFHGTYILCESSDSLVLIDHHAAHDGQFHGTYILCESSDSLVLIDHHAAHERILFEQLKKRASTSKTASQKRLIPETIDLGYREADILEKLIPDLNELGLEIEPFGGNTFVIKSAPAFLEDKEIKPLVIEIVEKMAEIGFTPGLEKALDECLILMACHGAIRANQTLSENQIKLLLKQLDECEQPSNCPHGRPTWISWSIKDLEKSFKRIV
jgi:DNA mismatch repair protein MutL